MISRHLNMPFVLLAILNLAFLPMNVAAQPKPQATPTPKTLEEVDDSDLDSFGSLEEEEVIQLEKESLLEEAQQGDGAQVEEGEEDAGVSGEGAEGETEEGGGETSDGIQEEASEENSPASAQEEKSADPAAEEDFSDLEDDVEEAAPKPRSRGQKD